MLLKALFNGIVRISTNQLEINFKNEEISFELIIHDMIAYMFLGETL